MRFATVAVVIACAASNASIVCGSYDAPLSFAVLRHHGQPFGISVQRLELPSVWCAIASFPSPYVLYGIAQCVSCSRSFHVCRTTPDCVTYCVVQFLHCMRHLYLVVHKRSRATIWNFGAAPRASHCVVRYRVLSFPACVVRSCTMSTLSYIVSCV